MKPKLVPNIPKGYWIFKDEDEPGITHYENGKAIIYDSKACQGQRVILKCKTPILAKGTSLFRFTVKKCSDDSYPFQIDSVTEGDKFTGTEDTVNTNDHFRLKINHPYANLPILKNDEVVDSYQIAGTINDQGDNFLFFTINIQCYQNVALTIEDCETEKSDQDHYDPE